jgi:hypothetical protein
VLGKDMFKVKIGSETQGFENAPLSLAATFYNDEATATSFKQSTNAQDAALVFALDYSIRDDVNGMTINDESVLNRFSTSLNSCSRCECFWLNRRRASR